MDSGEDYGMVVEVSPVRSAGRPEGNLTMSIRFASHPPHPGALRRLLSATALAALLLCVLPLPGQTQTPTATSETSATSTAEAPLPGTPTTGVAPGAVVSNQALAQEPAPESSAAAQEASAEQQALAAKIATFLDVSHIEVRSGRDREAVLGSVDQKLIAIVLSERYKAFNKRNFKRLRMLFTGQGKIEAQKQYDDMEAERMPDYLTLTEPYFTDINVAGASATARFHETVNGLRKTRRVVKAEMRLAGNIWKIAGLTYVDTNNEYK